MLKLANTITIIIIIYNSEIYEDIPVLVSNRYSSSVFLYFLFNQNHDELPYLTAIVRGVVSPMVPNIMV